MPDQTVDTLMVDGTSSWDSELIRTIFDDEVAAKILQVPISRHGGDDFASWPWTRFGSYSVRSAYHLARSERVASDRSKHGQGSSSVVSDNSKIWKKLWASKAPGKMKITLWRFAHDCLPCGHQLQKRHVPTPSTCVYCNKHETIEHALLFCPYVDEVWREVKDDFHIHLNRKAFISPRVWTLNFVDSCSDLEATVLMVSLWHIWDARNKYREGEGFMHPKSIAAKIKAYIDMICIHLYKPMTAIRREPSSSTPKWVPPPAGMVLVNVDAATFSSTR
jgi:predicted Zn-ribbon and HTH transcriptional regulator